MARHETSSVRRDTTRPTPHDTFGLAAKLGAAAPPLTMVAWLNTPKWLRAAAPAPLHFGDGHVYVLGFTSWWCSNCPLNYNPLQDLAKKYADQGVRVLLVTAFYGKDLKALQHEFQNPGGNINFQFSQAFSGTFGGGNGGTQDTQEAIRPITLPIAIEGVPNDTTETEDWTPPNFRRFLGVGQGIPEVFVIDQRGIVRYHEYNTAGVAAVLEKLVPVAGTKH